MELTMVTTNSLGKDLSVTVDSLKSSDFDEDRVLAREFEKTFKALVNEMLPIILYVDERIERLRGIELGKMRGHGRLRAVLGRDGKVYKVGEPGSNYVHQEDFSWEYVVFSELCENIRVALQLAYARKEQHLNSIKGRLELLNGIQALLQSGSQA